MANKQPLGRLTFLVFGLLFCWASVCFSAVPTTINFQGQLTDDLGDPLPDGTYDMWFYLFDAETGGNQLWNSPDGEQQTVTVNKGIYNVQLGAIEPLDSKFFMNGKVWLEVAIYNTDTSDFEILSPRQQLTAVPFAMQAGSTSAGAVTALMLADKAVTEAKVATGAITADKIDGGSGSGVDADMLDGLDAASFAPSIHNHDGHYYSQAYVDALEDRIEALEAKLQYLTVVAGSINGMAGPHVMITGANLHVRSGSGSTTGTINGQGNLIVGYNELRGSNDDRTGSHNIVTGNRQNYSSYGGLVAGQHNTISSGFSSVSGGYNNEASGSNASVSGGYSNTASDSSASVSGGSLNTASGLYASVSGGYSNTASGGNGSVSGGWDNTASNTRSSVSGGRNNNASGISATVSGGLSNTASNYYSSVSGGDNNQASGQSASVSGGSDNTASDYNASISGGRNNIANGRWSFVGGGGGADASDGNEAFSYYSAILGGYKNLAGNKPSADHTIDTHSTVSGGSSNTVRAYYGSISGGINNFVTGDSASVSGGYNNWASGSFSSISGGILNGTSGENASVSGGAHSTASGNSASVSGGTNNTASGNFASVSGGRYNTASGSSSTVSGGSTRSVSNFADWRAGGYFQDD